MAKKKMDNVQVFVHLEQSRMNREKSLLLFDKSIIMYFAFIFVGVVGFVSGLFDNQFMTLMIVLSFGVLAIGTVPYIITMHTEEKRFKSILRKNKWELK
jgi:ABC-type multidrug transport system permease subunit